MRRNHESDRDHIIVTSMCRFEAGYTRIYTATAEQASAVAEVDVYGFSLSMRQ